MRSRGGHDGISALIRRDTRALSLPCGDAARRWPSESQEGGPHPALLTPDSWASSLRSVILLCGPELTRTRSDGNRFKSQLCQVLAPIGQVGAQKGRVS